MKFCRVACFPEELVAYVVRVEVLWHMNSASLRKP